MRRVIINPVGDKVHFYIYIINYNWPWWMFWRERRYPREVQYYGSYTIWFTKTGGDFVRCNSFTEAFLSELLTRHIATQEVSWVLE